MKRALPVDDNGLLKEEAFPNSFRFPTLSDSYFSSHLPSSLPENFVFHGSCENFLYQAKRERKRFQLIFTSPPYNLGKPYSDYADDRSLEEYLEWQEDIITKCTECLVDAGSICWQVGNYVDNGMILPLDMVLYPIFKRLGLQLRN